MKQLSRKSWRVIRKNLDAGTCVNDDGRPICPPSKVLCRECLDILGDDLRALLARIEGRSMMNADAEVQR